MISEPFAIGTSIIHQLDPRIRVALTSVYAFVVALSYHFPVLITALALSTVLMIISQVRLTAVLKRMIWVNAFIVLLWLLLPFTFKGDVLASVGSFAIYRPGVVMAAQITLKSYAILLAFIALIATMSFATLGHALYRLRVPEKIVHLLLMTYRYVFVIEQEYLRLLRAAKIRGFRPGTNSNTYVLTQDEGTFMLWTILGGIGAALAFSMTVAGLPLLVERDITTPQAVYASIRAVSENPATMMLWAMTIAVGVNSRPMEPSGPALDSRR